MVDDRPVAVFGIALTTAATTNLHKELVTPNIVVIGLLTLLAPAAGYFFAKAFSGRIRKLANAAVEIGKGQLDTRLDTKSRDEVGSLAESFNQIANELQEA